jgi:hypothetical protein
MMRSLLFVSLFSMGSSGCGLISSDVGDFPLSIKERSFSIDTASWMIDAVAVPDYLGMDCTAAPTVCSAAAQQACTDCTGTCSDLTHTCELGLRVATMQKIDLATEQSELQGIDGQTAIHVTIDGATYTIDSNTLNVATPVLSIYVAPASITEPNDPSVKLIGSIASQAAMTTTMGPQDIVYTATGRADLTAAMKAWSTPFNLLVGAMVVVTATDPVPTGAATAKVQIKAHAGFD